MKIPESGQLFLPASLEQGHRLQPEPGHAGNIGFGLR